MLAVVERALGKAGGFNEHYGWCALPSSFCPAKVLRGSARLRSSTVSKIGKLLFTMLY